MTTATQPTVSDYARIFEAERQNEYPVIDAFEVRMGYTIDRAKLEEAARVLACPLKKNPPNWQHGRVIYTAARKYLTGQLGHITIVDIGTAKGFSALCLLWALQDSGLQGIVASVDVLDPKARVRRNTVAECGGYQTLVETLDSWPDSRQIVFYKMTGTAVLAVSQERIHTAFIDGKHAHDVVLEEGRLLYQRQEAGDLAIFDDLQLIGSAVDQLEAEGRYRFERLYIKPGRGYAVGVRRG